MEIPIQLTPEQIRAKVSICSVDDCAYICSSLNAIMRRMDFNTQNMVSIYGHKAAFELEHALEIYKTYEPELSWKIPNLLFLDWNMPGISGLDLLKKIRGYDDPRISNMIVVIVTAEALRERVIAAIQAGVDNYITKPLNQSLVEKKLKEIGTSILRKAERLIQKSPDKINNIIETLNLAIAMDFDNKQAQAMKHAVLSSNHKEVVKIIDIKVKGGKDSADKGKYSRAVGEFGNALDLKPSDPKALMEYGKMMMKKTLYEEAVTSFESALKYLQDDVEAQQLIREVDLLDLLGEAQLKLAMTLEHSDEMTEKAINTLKKASNLYRGKKDEMGQAKSMSNIGKVHAARATEAEKKAKLAVGIAKAKYKKEAQRHNERAIKEYEDALRQDIKQSAALTKLAQAYRKTGKEDEAGKVMEKAMDLQPEDPDALIEFGKEFLDKGENETAMFYFNSAKKKLSIEDTEAYEEIILPLLEHDLPEKAVPFINTIAEERPGLYNNLGLAYRRENKLKEAIEAYGKAIKYDIAGDRLSYLYNQGMAYKAAGNVASAIKNFFQAYKMDKTFEKAAEQLGKDCTSLCNRAQQYLKNNDRDSAIFNYKLAFVANPNSDAAKNGLNRLNIDPATILNEGELEQLGIDDPAVILKDFGG